MKESGPHQERKPWEPTPEYFQSNPRSNAIRNVCIGIIKNAEALMHNPEVAADKNLQRSHYAELESLNGQLIELDITPSMNLNRPLEDYQTNPEIAAEFVAGQLYEFTGSTVPSESNMIPLYQEFDESDGELPISPLIDASIMPDPIIDFAAKRDALNISKYCLAIPDIKNKEEEI